MAREVAMARDVARAKSSERPAVTSARTLTKPAVFLVRMLVFLILAAFVVAILAHQVREAFLTNPGLNGVILAVLAIGIAHAFRQVMRLYPEVTWVNEFRISDPGLAHTRREPTLLAPMATMLRDRRGTLSLSTTSMRTIMDSIGSRLDEARDTGRYMTGLLVFLGLLGTFWGLLDTITAVGKAITELDTKGGESARMFEELKTGLAAPLRGMGTAFSASLLGLAGSLILGFLDLQASHSHNRFYNELEEWLSGITELAPAGSQSGDVASAQLYRALTEMQHSIVTISERIDQGAGQANGHNVEQSVQELAKGVDQLIRQMRSEQKVVREWVDEQAAQQSEVASVLKDLASNLGRRN